MMVLTLTSKPIVDKVKFVPYMWNWIMNKMIEQQMVVMRIGLCLNKSK